jgi:transcriptional regulator with XRE-family HTH domain
VSQTGAGAGKRPTLEDVAARTGMSRSLVSLVLRGARTGATAETRERVLQAAAEIGYRPDARARLLASGESRLIGVVFGIAGRFHMELLDGLYHAARKAEYQLILSALTPRRDEREAVETLLDLPGTPPSTSSAPPTTRGCAWPWTTWPTSATGGSCTSTAAPGRSPRPDARAIGLRCGGAA